MIVVASTIAPWKAGGKEEGDVAWLQRAEEMTKLSPEPLRWFLAMETDSRPAMPRYTRLITRIGEFAGLDKDLFTIWNFQINDGEKAITSGNRLVRICTGRNLAHEFAMRSGASHILFLDTDIEVQDPDCIAKLLDVDESVVGGHVPNYGMSGPPVDDLGNLQRHWNTAGFLMLNRDAFRAVRWGYDLDKGLTDDPWTQGQLVKLGFNETVVRHDVIGVHVEALIPVEARQADKELRF